MKLGPAHELPDLSGLDVLRGIRGADGVEARFDRRLPVIVLSGRGAETDRVRGFEAVADDNLVKVPVSFASFPRSNRSCGEVLWLGGGGVS